MVKVLFYSRCWEEKKQTSLLLLKQFLKKYKHCRPLGAVQFLCLHICVHFLPRALVWGNSMSHCYLHNVPSYQFIKEPTKSKMMMIIHNDQGFEHLDKHCGFHHESSLQQAQEHACQDDYMKQGSKRQSQDLKRQEKKSRVKRKQFNSSATSC